MIGSKTVKPRLLPLTACWLITLGLFTTGVWPADVAETREQLVRRGLHQMHATHFDSAFAIAAELRRLWPDHPAGYLIAANVYQTMMRDYRVRLFEAQFDSSIDQAIQLAQRESRQRPQAETWFALGAARGYQALHRFRCGDWSAALRDVVLSLHDMERATDCDPEFVDPVLALALYEYWKSAKLDLGLGIFARKRKFAIRLLEKVWAQGRYVANDAAYSLQTIHLQEGNYARALEINNWIHERYPQNPICLYHRALIFEKLNRPHDALAVWVRVIVCIQALQKASDGFLAECHWRRAQLFEIMLASGSNREVRLQIDAALKQAAKHVRQRDAAVELEGPFESYGEIKKAVEHMLKKYSI